MRVARPGEISKVQFHRTIQPPQLRNPEQGRKERTPWLFFRDLPAHFVDSTANDPIPTRILTGAAQTRRLSASPVERAANSPCSNLLSLSAK
jgi:hypothetical protein